MPTGNAHLPDDGTDLARRVIELGTQLKRLAAAGQIVAAVGLPWSDLDLLAGWTPAGPPWASPQIRAQIDGMAQLSGSIVPGTLAPGTVIATLPYAPPGDIEVRVGGGATTAAVDLTITAAGNLTVQATTGSVIRVSLNTVRFPRA